MAYRDLQEFMRRLKRAGELVRIQTQVDPVLEITEIVDRISKRHGPALLFENVKGSEFPILINAFGSKQRMAWALGVEEIDQIAQSVQRILELPGGGGSWFDKLKQLPKLLELGRYFPKKVRYAPAQEVMKTGSQVNLKELPVLTCWPQDGGPYIYAALGV